MFVPTCTSYLLGLNVCQGSPSSSLSSSYWVPDAANISRASSAKPRALKYDSLKAGMVCIQFIQRHLKIESENVEFKYIQ